MKKVILLLLMTIGVFTFSNTLEKVTYKDGVYIATFKDKKKLETQVKYNKEQNILMIDLQNTKKKWSIPETLKINDDNLEKISTTEIAGFLTTSFYLKKSIDYSIENSNGEIKINFKKKVETPPQTLNTTSSVVFKPTTPTKKKKYTIVVDAGHGGKDSGAVGNGYREKDIALAVAKKLAENLEKDFNVIMTRKTDVFIPLQTRAKIGNDANADLFVSIHLNSSPNTGSNGTEVFYFSKKESAYAAEVAKFENSVDSGYADIPLSDFILNDIFYRVNQQRSALIATDVLDNIINTFGLRRRGVFGANFAVLRGSNSPAILIEIGFISNYKDIEQYLTDSGKEKVAEDIAKGIRKHFE